MNYTYIPSGVCSRKIEIEVDGGTIIDVKFTGGCDGNLKGICGLIKGLEIGEVISRLSGIECGMKKTSCPDQLCKALQEIYQKA